MRIHRRNGLSIRALAGGWASLLLLAACQSLPVESPAPASVVAAEPVVEQSPSDPMAPHEPPLMRGDHLGTAGLSRFAEAEAAEREGNFRAARAGWQALAEAGHAESQYRLALLQESGKGGVVDAAAALAGFLRAAAQAHPAAHCRAGALLMRRSDADLAGALQHWQRGAEAGESECMRRLARELLEGPVAVRAPADGLRWLERAADAGEAEAPFALGEILRTGRHGVPRDLPRARHWLAVAADQGASAEASHLLAHLYETGLGGKRDAALAARYYAFAAEAGRGESAHRLGVLYRLGSGVEKDATRAATMFARALDLGVAKAAVNLGDLYFLGLGVERDHARAFALYAQAADRGVPWGLCRQSAMLRFGEGVARDLRQAQALEAKVRAGIPTANCRIPLTKLLHP